MQLKYSSPSFPFDSLRLPVTRDASQVTVTPDSKEESGSNGRIKKRFHFFPSERLSYQFQRDDRKRQSSLRRTKAVTGSGIWSPRSAENDDQEKRDTRSRVVAGGTTSPADSIISLHCTIISSPRFSNRPFETSIPCRQPRTRISSLHEHRKQHVLSRDSSQIVHLLLPATPSLPSSLFLAVTMSLSSVQTLFSSE